MLQEIITKIEQSIQCVLCYLLNLCFQPIYCILQIVQGIIDIWTAEDEVEEPVQQPQQTITTYPSTNEGRYADEVELPACDKEHHIGFRINQTEQDELDKIKKQLKNGE